ncbi:ROK family transcriptional regulator [Arthrobacter sp. UYEF20]|uniref:ROK family transcriptional regulator n=1 Tax=Arthrobacter sp. UYEF20 TaxID=1756363 RepID=UPI00339B1FE7
MVLGAPSKLRILNDQAALLHILEAGILSRAQLEELTGLSKPATAELLGRLEVAGLVKKEGKRGGGPGPKAQLWAISPEAGFAAAVDVTPSGIGLQISDLSGRVRIATFTAWNNEAPARQIRECLDAACTESGVPRSGILKLVVGLPGAVDPRSGLLKYAPHLPAWGGYDVISALRAELGTGVDVENDVNLMAMGEMKDGLASGVENFALVWVDDGLGSAIVLRGELLKGFTGGAGEIDYAPVPDRSSVETGQTRHGSNLGALLSPAAISELAAAHGLVAPDPMAAVELALQEMAAKEDGSGSRFMEDLAIRLATGLAAIVTVIDPELIMLGGKFGAAGGTKLAELVQQKLSSVLAIPAAATAQILSYPVTEGAALSGAMGSALAGAREKAFETGSVIQHSPILPGPYPPASNPQQFTSLEKS